ncbi:MAG: tetratricopeptide repeat protein [Alphaproteobacteria bacterium]
MTQPPSDNASFPGTGADRDTARRNAVDAHLQQGYGHHQAGDPRTALEHYRRALDADPGHVDALYLAGVACFQLLDPAEAESLLRTALSIDSDRSDILINLGNCLQMQNRLADAEQASRGAIAADPGIPEAHNNLGNVLKELGDAEQAEASFRRALALDPGYAGALCNLASSLRGQGKTAEAEEACRRAIDLDPDLDAAYIQLAGLLRERERFAEAQAAAEKAVAINPKGVEHHAMLASILHRQGETAAAIAACDRLLAIRPRDSTILAAKSLLLNDLHGPETVNPYLDYDRIITTIRFDRAEGYATLHDFHAALREYAGRHPRLEFEPRFKSTRHGFQAEHLEEDTAAPVEALKGLIAEAAGRYCERCAKTPGHPLAPPPEALSVSIWVTILNPTGHQDSHFHPSAWLSGVYYVALPPAMKRDDNSRAGWIEFGRPADERPYKAPPNLRNIRPEEGLMVLFPSYLYHRTIPFTGEGPSAAPEQRISIAFDVLAG